jgi:hypothetical protein
MMGKHYPLELMSQHQSPHLQARFPHILRIVAGTSLLLSSLLAIALPTAAALTRAGTISTLTKNSPTAIEIARLDLTSPLPTNYNQNSRSLLKISTLKTYRHPSKLFSIDVPQKWQLENFSEPNHIRVQWQDANHHGLICVELFNFAGRVTAEELGTQLSEVLQKVYGNHDRLNISQPITQSNGSVRVNWSYVKQTDNGAIVSYKGKSFIQQIGNKISASYYVVPDRQTTQLAAPFDRIIRSYRINPDIDIP